MRDITLGETVYFDFTTRAFATGVPTTLTSSPTAEVLEQNNASPIAAGVTVIVDRGGVPGLNMVSIDSSESGFETGKSYSIYLTAGTVDGVGVAGEIVGQFTIDALNQKIRNSMELASTGSGPAVGSIDDKLDTIITTQESQTPVEQVQTAAAVATGTATGSPSNTEIQNGSLWSIESVAGGISATITFQIGTDEKVPSSLTMSAYFDSGKGRVLQIQAYNFDQDAYENRGAVQSSSTALGEISLGLTGSHVRGGQGGTPGIDGDVLIRFYYHTDVSGKVNAGDFWHIDVAKVHWIKSGVTLGELLDGIDNANPQRNYPGAAITINTENGVPGTTLGKNGTPGSPCNTLAQARILADSLGFSRYILEGANTEITLDENYDGWQFISVVFGGKVIGGSQSTVGAVFLNMILEGTFAGRIEGTQCSLADITTEGFFQECTFPLATSVTLTGDSIFRQCDSTLPGATNPGIDCANVVNINLSITKYAGGIDISNLHDGANVTVSGRGSLGLPDVSTLAKVIVSGHIRIQGALPTGIDLVDLARIDTGQIDKTITEYGENSVLTEDYAGNGLEPTQNQMLYAIHQMLMDFSITGTSLTVERLNNGGTAFTVTLDDDTNPTSANRA